MAYITFLNGQTKPIDSVKAIKMQLILKGKREATADQLKFLETVASISFNANRTMKLPKPRADVGRLPYADD